MPRKNPNDPHTHPNYGVELSKMEVLEKIQPYLMLGLSIQKAV